MIYGYKVVALCMAKVHDDESNKFIKALNECCIANGYRLFVYGLCSDLFWNTPYEAGEASVFDLIDSRVVDAVIIYEERIKNKTVVQKIIEKAQREQTPVITVGEEYSGCVNVRFAYDIGFEQIVRHVIDVHGLTKLHFMAGMKNNFFSDERLNAFRKVLAEKGLSFDESMVSYGEFWEGPTVTAMEKLIAGGTIPEAIICANDSMAITVSDVLQKHGFSIPGDVLVTGFDGVDEINFCSPKITSCCCDYADLSEEIVRMLAKCPNGEIKEERYFVVPRMILSESCGCVENYSINASEYLTQMNARVYMLLESNRSLIETSIKIQNCENAEHVSEDLMKTAGLPAGEEEQKKSLSLIMQIAAMVSGDMPTGVYYWEPLCIPGKTYGSWDENMGMLDTRGKALCSFEAYRDFNPMYPPFEDVEKYMEELYAVDESMMVQPGTNPIPNGDFRDGTKGWWITKNPEDVEVVEQDGEVYVSAKCNFTMELFREIHISQKGRYRLSVEYRGTNTTGVQVELF